MKSLFTPLLLAAALTAGASTAPLWLRDVRISPDGSKIAFTYKGDIFTVPSGGGTATRLTTAPSYESAPVWSPDGNTLAFASDREGGLDVYTMSATGGPATRLTWHSARETPYTFTPDGKYVVYGAAIQGPAASALFPTSRMGQLWRVPAGGGRPEQVIGSPAQDVHYLADGRSFVYHDDKGTENMWRKHHTSAVARDVWRYDAHTGRHTKLTGTHSGEDRTPVPSPDGKTLYFLSERNGGPFNIYSAPASDLSHPKAVTSFKTHPVRFLSGAADGRLAFGYDGEIYTMVPGGKPVKVAVDIVTDDLPKVDRLKVTSAQDAQPSPDGKQMAFAHHGDIFVTSVEYPSTRQVTFTPQAEDAPAWGKDSRTLYYTSMRDGHANIYKAVIGRADDPDFSNATVVDESPVFKPGDGISRMNPLVSPDGGKMAFVQDGNMIAVLDLNTGKVKLLTHGETYTSHDGDIEMQWSPDSRWLVATVDVHQRDPYYDIALFNADTGAMTNITDDAYMNSSPRFVMDGNAIVYTTDRYGMKNHASWGATGDAMMVYLNQDAYDRARLSKEDLALLKEAEKAQKKKDAKDANEAKDTRAIEVELDGLADRIVRITPFSSKIGDIWVDNDGENAYFTTNLNGSWEIWKRSLRSGDTSMFKKIGAEGVRFEPDAAGKTLFLMGSNPRKMTVPGGSMESISFNATQEIDRSLEREAMYDFIADIESRFFLVKDMFGADWKGLVKNSRRFLPHINNNYDFSILASELLGELNVSHTGSGYRSQAARQATGQLGLLYDLDYRGDGLKVAEVLAKGPFGRKSSAMQPGAVITAIDGHKLTAAADPLALLNGRVGQKTLVAFTLPSGEKAEEVVKPVTAAAISDMMYDRWVERNRHTVDSLSGGRLGYVHIESMDDPSYRKIYGDVLGRYAQREGIVIDTRHNGGGRLHEDIEVLFSGRKYLTQERRGVKSGEMPSKRWLRPSVMITSEANYSNAHGTPWMYRHNGLGKIVGMPVPGTMSSVNWITLQDPSLYFGVPVVGFKTAQGNYLENTQLEPDVKVANDPALIVKGHDDQLIQAVKTLLDEIDADSRK